MIKTITIAAYDRPQNLALLLRSLRNQLLPLNGYRLLVRVDRGAPTFAKVRAVAEAAGFVDLVVNPRKHQGLNRNCYETVRWAFEEAEADFSVYLEEDFVLSPDALNLVEWYIAHGRELLSGSGVRDIAAYCLCVTPRLRAQLVRDTLDPEEVFLSQALQGWGLVFSRRQWKNYISPGWYRGNERHGTWDKLLARHIRTFPGVYNAIPALSRTSNTGREGRTPSGKYASQMKGHVYKQDRYMCDFRCIGVRPCVSSPTT